MSKTAQRKRTARERHKVNKLRARYRKILGEYQPAGIWWVSTPNPQVMPAFSLTFDGMVQKLLELNNKCLQRLLSDIDSGERLHTNKVHMVLSNGDRERLKTEITNALLERMVLE